MARRRISTTRSMSDASYLPSQWIDSRRRLMRFASSPTASTVSSSGHRTAGNTRFAMSHCRPRSPCSAYSLRTTHENGTASSPSGIRTRSHSRTASPRSTKGVVSMSRLSQAAQGTRRDEGSRHLADARDGGYVQGPFAIGQNGTVGRSLDGADVEVHRLDEHAGELRRSGARPLVHEPWNPRQPMAARQPEDRQRLPQ